MSTPAELAILKPPTKADALAYLQRGWRTIPEWETTVHGKHCAGGRYSQEMCQTYRVEFDEQREAAIADALLTLTHEYKALLDGKAQRQSREDAQRAEARDALLKPAMAAFLASGGTQAEWDQQAPQIEAQIRQQRAVDAALGNDPVTREMARLLATGQYGL